MKERLAHKVEFLYHGIGMQWLTQNISGIPAPSL